MNTFKSSVRRFGMLIRSDLSKNYKSILILLLVMVGLYLMAALFNGIHGMYNVRRTFEAYIGTIIALLPFMFYKNLFHPVKGVSYSMIPASQSEKFASIFVQCTILIPVVMLCFAWLVTLIGVGLTGEKDLLFNFPAYFSGNFDLFESGRTSLRFFDSFFWVSVGIFQSVSLWGVCFFKTKKLWKTFLTLCCWGIALSITGLTCLRAIGRPGTYILTMSAYSDRIIMLGNLFFGILLPFILWVWAFFKMRRQQI